MKDNIDTEDFNELFFRAVYSYNNCDYKSALKLADKLLKIKKNILNAEI